MIGALTKRLVVYRLLSPFVIKPNREMLLFAGIALAALGLRLWELDGRAMHYDEGIHVHYAWLMSIGDGYSHSPWMHGPFQVHLTALIFTLFSDSDFTARLGYALFGSALVFLPYFLRTYLGRNGAIITSVLLALSPSLLYLSRFGRNEIFMAFWALALVVLMWRYLNEGKNRYLYIASAVLALAFATKETSYIVVIVFGAALFLMSLTEIIPFIMGRIGLSDLRGPAALLILLFSLTLPQWSALASIPMSAFGLELVNEGVGDVGLPVLGPPYLSFPLVAMPLAFKALVALAILAIPLGALITHKIRWSHARWLLPGALLAALTFVVVAFPEGLVARSYLVSFGVLAVALTVSVIIGLMWQWKVWLVCAGVFYLIWAALYTSMFGAFVQHHGYCPNEAGNFFSTVCAKLGGVYTGSWQGLGYWLAQQDVARGGQPWYYHFLLGSVYEFLPMVFGAVAVIYYLRKRDLFGLFLSFWAVINFMAYTLAAEKMPWLLVNIAVPFIVLAGKFIGEIMERVRWSRVLRSVPVALLIIAPLQLLAGIYLLQRFLEDGLHYTWQSWWLLVAIAAIAVVSAHLIKLARPSTGVTLAALGVAALMLGFSSFVAFRASYTYDDSPVEMLVYAQGSADIANIVNTLNNDGVFDSSELEQIVDVDYELWYPLNWYVRHQNKDRTLGFKCYKDEGEDGYVDWCNKLEDPPSLKALLLNEMHGNRDASLLRDYEKTGPFSNLLWFPETYRRPGENRKGEGKYLSMLPSGTQLKKDFNFVKETFSSREPWKDAVDYFLYRRVSGQWWDSKFYAYISEEEPF